MIYNWKSYKRLIKCNKHFITRVTRGESSLCVCALISCYIWSGNTIKPKHTHIHISFFLLAQKQKTGTLGFSGISHTTFHLNYCSFLRSNSCCSTHRIPASPQRSCSSLLFQMLVYPWLQSNPLLSPQAS